MDNQKPQNPQGQSSGPQEQSSNYVISSQSKKVIQPSAELEQEVKAELAERSAKEAARVVEQSKVRPSLSTNATEAQPKSTTASNSIYPEPTAGFGTKVPMPTPAPELTADQSKALANGAKKVIAVRVVAGILMILQIIGFYDWYLVYHAGYTSVGNAIWICITLILLIGIAKLVELARIIYVVIAVLGLIFFSITLFELYVHKQIVFQPTVNSAEIATEKQNLEFELKQNSPRASASQNKQDHVAEQRLLNSISGSTTDLNIKRNLSVVLGIVEAIGPLIFLTRPSIKRVFS